MTIGVLQAVEAFADNVALTVSAGSALWVVGGADVASTPGITVSDTVNGSYGAALTPGAVTDAANDIGLIAFLKLSAGAGATTVTANGSAVILVLEIGDVHATSSLQDSDGQQQTGPGAGADAVTTPNMTLTNDPGLIVGCSLNCGFTTAPTAGTSFTSHGAIWNPGGGAIARAESRRVTSAGSFAATFTRAAAQNHISIGAILREAAGGGGGGQVILPPPPRPNRRSLLGVGSRRYGAIWSAGAP